MAGRHPVRRALLALVALTALAVGVVDVAAGEDPGGDLPINPQWLANTLTRAATTGNVQNNLIPGALVRRDKALADYRAALARHQRGQGPAPSPLAKPEYVVVWSGKQNAGDVHAKDISDFINNSTINPQGVSDLLDPQFLPGLDGFQVIDVRRQNVDGTRNHDYGKVVNFVQLPLPWGVEAEPHHMQYQWLDGQPIIAGGLFNDTTFVLSVKDIPNMKLQNIIAPQDTPSGTIPDAYDAVGDGRFIGTYMGGPEENFGGSPGDVTVFKPDPQKGLVVESETPGGSPGGVVTGNANGVPEPCDAREARPLGTCANPHGIEIRQDLHRMVTADYAEPREIVLDPLKTVDKYTFRPTVRVWDTTDPAKPKLVSVAHMPAGPRDPAQRAHENYGIMEDAKTWPTDRRHYPGMLSSKGMFSGAMCGGGIFFTPDVTKLKGDSSSLWRQVWDDGLTQALTHKADANGVIGAFEDEPGACAGGAWHQVSRDNRWLFRSVQGRAQGADNAFDEGSEKLVYDIDISPLVRAANRGRILCDLTNGIHTAGYDLSGMELFNELAQGHHVADCPRFISSLVVHDPTSGGPHWGALDNHSLRANGTPTRLVFSDYFVSRTGVDGDHRLYLADISPQGKLAYDWSFRDEKTGSLGVNFNRRNWPGSPDAGFYKPHSMVWVCPPALCRGS